MRSLFRSVAIATLLSFNCLPAQCLEIQAITSPGGITAWLAEDQSTSIVSLRFAFLAGSADDPEGKSGLANVLAKVMSEGGRGGGAETFKQMVAKRQARFSFEAGRDTIQGQLDAPADSFEDVANVAANVIEGHTIDAAVFSYAAHEATAEAAEAVRDPSFIAEDTWMAAAFAGHGYARPTYGASDALANLTLGDLEAFASGNFTRSRLKVVAAGHIDSQTLGRILDRMFGALPLGSPDYLAPRLRVTVPGRPLSIPLPTPEVILRFGAGAPGRMDADFTAAVVMNEILGGAPFGSRLTRALREDAGLAYSVSTRIVTDRFASVFTGEASIGAGEAERAMAIVRSEAQRLASEGPSSRELADAKARLVGSYGFGFDSTRRVAENLLASLLDELPSDHIAQRQAAIEAVTIDDVRRTASIVLGSEKLWFVLAGGSPAPVGRTKAQIAE